MIGNQFEHITHSTPIRTEQDYRCPESAESSPKLNYYACFNHYYGASNWKQKFACSIGTPIENLIWKITDNWRGVGGHLHEIIVPRPSLRLEGIQAADSQGF